MGRRAHSKNITVVPRRKKMVVYITVEHKVTSYGPVYTALAEVIRNLRFGLNMTQEDVAKALGMSRTSLTNIEAGRQRVYLEDVWNLASILKTEPKKLFAAIEEELRHHTS